MTRRLRTRVPRTAVTGTIAHAHQNGVMHARSTSGDITCMHNGSVPAFTASQQHFVRFPMVAMQIMSLIEQLCVRARRLAYALCLQGRANACQVICMHCPHKHSTSTAYKAVLVSSSAVYSFFRQGHKVQVLRSKCNTRTQRTLNKAPTTTLLHQCEQQCDGQLLCFSPHRGLQPMSTPDDPGCCILRYNRKGRERATEDEKG